MSSTGFCFNQWAGRQTKTKLCHIYF